jgi:hypothetical protein
MPFDLKGLTRLTQFGTVGNVATPSFWTYATNETHAQVTAVGYFNAQAPFMRPGDVIQAITGIGGTPVFRIYVVTAVTATVVTITAVTGASWT